MQTITLQPGEELRVVCAGSRNNGTKKNNAALGAPSTNIPKPANNSEGGITGFLKGITGGKRNKTRKNQAGGKRGPNGYMKFAKEMRPKILKENPSMRSNVVAVAKKIGEAWRALPESERKKY